MARGRPKKVVEEKAEGAAELAPLMKEMDKRYGIGVIRKGSEVLQPLRISTGVFVLDFCLLGGIPVSRGTMLIGKKHSGKTTLSCKLAAQAQLMFPDQQVAVVDVEGTFDEVWARKNDVDTDRLIVAHPESGEAACDITDALIRTREISMVIVDSVAALAPMKEITSSAEDAHVGLQARLMGGLLRKTTAGMITERRRGHMVTPVYINQYRSKIGGFSGFGEPLSVPGGHALGFANSVEIVIKNKENIGKNEQGIDAMAFNEHAYNIPKNKCNGGTRAGEFRLMRQYDPKTGLGECAVDDAGTMLAYAKKYGAYAGAGSAWNLVFWDEEHKFRGADDAISNLYADGDLYQKLRDYLIWENAKSLEMPQYFLDRFTEPHGYEP